MADFEAPEGFEDVGVLMPPTDAPWVRMTILSDPQGAVFTASKFTPPTA